MLTTAKKTRSKANGEGTIYKEIRNGKPYYKATIAHGYDSKGKLIRKSFCGYKKQDVIKKMAKYKYKQLSGMLPSDDKMTLEDWVYIWLYEFRINDLKPSSFSRYESIYRNYIKDTPLGQEKLADYRTATLQRYYNSLLDGGKTSNNIRTLHKFITTSVIAAVRQEYIPLNFCRGVILPKKSSNKDIVVFTLEEQEIFVAGVQNHRFRCFFLLALGTGMRLGELLALKWDDIDLDSKKLSITKAIKSVTIINKDGSRSWQIIEQSPKTESSIRTISIPSSLIAEINLHRISQLEEKTKDSEFYQDNNLVFCGAFGQHIDERNLRRSYSRLLKKIGIDYKKFHSLRHTYATRLFELNVSPRTVQSLLGHKDSTTTMNIYTHVMPEKMSEDVEKLNIFF